MSEQVKCSLGELGVEFYIRLTPCREREWRADCIGNPSLFAYGDTPFAAIKNLRSAFYGK